LIAVQLLLTLGIACIFAVGQRFFRDVGIILEFIGMIWFLFDADFLSAHLRSGPFDSRANG
jgi:ABC-type polysaccharide/polyol phosphate export permease